MVNMEEMQDNGENVCRICDRSSDQMFGVFDKTESGKQILNLIKEVLPIVIYRTDPLPKQICDLCFENLETSYQLKLTALDTLALQKERLKNTPNEEGVELFLQTVDNVEVKENGLSDTQDATTETNQEKPKPSGEVLCSKCNGKVEEAEEKPSLPAFQKIKIKPLSMMNGDISHEVINEEVNGDSSDMEICESDKEVQNLVTAPKRILEESPLIEPELKRRKIGPKSKTKCRNIIEKIHYKPVTLLQCALNAFNKIHVPDYEPEIFEKVVDYEVEPVCLHCDEMFVNVKQLALHESIEHIQVNLFDRVDDAVLWNKARSDSALRNRWLQECLDGLRTIPEDDDDEGCGDESQNLLMPIVEDNSSEPTNGTLCDEEDDEGITLVDCKPFYKGIPLVDIPKDDRRLLYKSIMVAGVKRKFCKLCRFTFKDNWAIELHYFTSACYYTCRFCGVRFNKQRQVFHEHVEEHIRSGHSYTRRIFAARKKNDPIPKVVQESDVKADEEEDEEWRPKPSVKVVKPLKMKSLLEKTRVPKTEPKEPIPDIKSNLGLPTGLTIKREPKTVADVDASNQAYFCRKCYKVFFKLDEFNVHVTACTGTGNNIYRIERMTHMRQREESPEESDDREEPSSSKSYSSSGRPVRRCVRGVATYNDNFDVEVESDKSHSSSPVSGYQCNLCSSIFPTVHSRNSHMRIHKNYNSSHMSNNLSISQNSHQIQKNKHPNLAKQAVTNMMNRHHESKSFNNSYDNVYIKQEPMEPEVEIHESETPKKVPHSIGNVSITPIAKKTAKPKPLNPEIMRLVQNNPNITIKTMGGTNREIKQEPKSEPSRHSGNYSQNSHKQNHYQQNSHHEKTSYQPKPQTSPSNSTNKSLDYSLQSQNSPDGEKMYRCSSCSKPFSNKSNLYFHKKNQCGGSRYPCPFCKKRFGTEAAYSSHIFYSHPE